MIPARPPILFRYRAGVLTASILLLAAIVAGLRAVPPIDPARALRPQDTAEMQVAARYATTFGAPPTLSVALMPREGSLYQARFLRQVATVADILRAQPGVRPGDVLALTDLDTRFVEIVEGRYYTSPVLPPEWLDTLNADQAAQLQSNVRAAGLLGRLVSGDGRATLIELTQPAAQLRPEGLRTLLQSALPRSAGVIVEIAGSDPGTAGLRGTPRLLAIPFGVAVLIGLVVRRVVLAALLAVAPCAAAWLAAAIAARLGSPVPWSIALPVFASVLLHHLEFAWRWRLRCRRGLPRDEAAVQVWREGRVTAAAAFLAAVAALAVLALPPVWALRALALAGVAGLLLGYLLERGALPLLLAGRRRHDRAPARPLGPAPAWTAIPMLLWRPELAAIGLTTAATVVGWGLWQRDGTGAAVAAAGGSAQAAQFIARAFPLAGQRLWVLAETEPGGCAQPQVLEQIDRLAWHLDNVPGVRLTDSLPETVRRIHTAFGEGSPKFDLVPHRPEMLRQALAPIPPSMRLVDARCGAMAIWVYTDGAAATLRRIGQAVAAYERDNAAEFFDAHRSLNPAYCAHLLDLRRASEPPAGPAPAPGLCPVHFEMGGGPAGLQAAQNAVIDRWGDGLWLAALIAAAVALGLLLRSLCAAVALLLPALPAAVLVGSLRAAQGIPLDFQTWPLAVFAVVIVAAIGPGFWQSADRPGARLAGLASLVLTALGLAAIAGLGGIEVAAMDWRALFATGLIALLLLPSLTALAQSEPAANTSVRGSY